MSKKLDRYNGFREFATQETPLLKCYEERKAVIVHMYPYGPRLRCPMAAWIDIKYHRGVNGCFRFAYRTPIRGYCERYTQKANDIIMSGSGNVLHSLLKDWFTENPPSVWNAPKYSHYALFMMLYWGINQDVPQNAGRVGKTDSCIFQFNFSSSAIVMLELLEFLKKSSCEWVGEEVAMPTVPAILFHGTMKAWSIMRGGTLEKAFGVGDDGKAKYERFMELRGIIPQLSSFDYK